MALRVGFDVDGVLADFRTAFLAESREAALKEIDSDPDDPGASVSETEIRRVWRKIGRIPNWWTTLSAYEPEQISRLYALARGSGWEVFFLTKRPETAGESVQVQTQYWLERHGYYLPSVVTVPGSRGELANALRLDLVIDDQVMNCVEVISASSAKAVLMLREPLRPGEPHVRDLATKRGIGVVSTLDESLNVLERLQQIMRERRGPLQRLTEWFVPAATAAEAVPPNPRAANPIPPVPTRRSGV